MENCKIDQNMNVSKNTDYPIKLAWSTYSTV